MAGKLEKLKRLTILFFSRNDIDNAIGLVRDINGIADEIVLIDQSDRKQKSKLMEFKRKARIKNFKVYDCVALGYPEPLQAYAFTKCTNEWVLRLDTDERMSEALKRDIKMVITEAKMDGFALRRYEYAGTNGKSGMSTWQIRLFKKGRTEYTGVLHEQPIIQGGLGKLEMNDYYISHSAGLMDEDFRTNAAFARYGEIAWIDQRLSYELYNRKVMEYISKFLVINQGQVPRTRIGRIVMGWMKFYENIFSKNQGRELSNFDYFVYYYIVALGYAMQREGPGKIEEFLKAPIAARNRMKGMRELQKLPDADVYFGISKMINKIGIIKFLELDNPAVMEDLTEKYKGKKHGVLLLMDLLKERYNQTNRGVPDTFQALSPNQVEPIPELEAEKKD